MLYIAINIYPWTIKWENSFFQLMKEEICSMAVEDVQHKLCEGAFMVQDSPSILTAATQHTKATLKEPTGLPRRQTPSCDIVFGHVQNVCCGMVL